MVRKITSRNFERFKFANTGDTIDNKEISDDIQQTLNRLMAWNTVSEVWDFVVLDSDGRLLVSSAPTKSDNNISSSLTLTTTDQQILAVNADRKQAIIQNTGSVVCYLGFGETPTVSDGFRLDVGATYIEDVWLGAINAITSSGTTTVQIQEMT